MDADLAPVRSGDPSLGTRMTVEALGAFALTFVAAGADVTARVSGGEVTPIARALAPGFLVMALIYAWGDRSGAHFNPVVSAAFALRRRFPVQLVLPYVAAQLAGAVAAAALLAALFGDAIDAGVTRPRLVEPWTAVAIEAVLTAILVTVILGTADRARVVGPNAAVAVGVTIALCGLVAIPIEGASMNPARSTGPALIARDLGDLWVYWLGPLMGAVIATALAWIVHGPPAPDGEAAKAASGGEDARRR